ncbi:MAG: oligopeptide transporter, OPT family [Candidatus Marinimicrobia bacterium]|nr:oligopeptide transporter, OPT family [Candidatus Neomarinimicrobiota bacterium]
MTHKGVPVANSKIPEITVKSLILGALLSMVLASANAYLGLFAGMTVSASIPAAVISMGILRLFRTHSIQENNIVQTSASAGESLAAGVIFTVPALILMGYWDSFDYWEITKLAALGGILGVLFTIPLRRALILEAKLQFPEGVATAEVLRSGEITAEDRSDPVRMATKREDVWIIAKAGLAGGFVKLMEQGFLAWHSALEGATRIGSSIFGFGSNLSPALISVGYIVGRNISSLIFMGGLISWFVGIPLYTKFHPMPDGAALDNAYDIWNAQIRYMGVGAMVVGGLWSLIKLFPALKQGIQSSLQVYKDRFSTVAVPKEEQDIPIQWVGIGALLSIIPIAMLYFKVLDNPVFAITLAILMPIFGFLFSAVASYMAGLVGSSNNPISGVTIATILLTSLILLLEMGTGNMAGAAGAILVGAVVCIAAAIGGDNMQDLKTGYLVGATPWKQQVMQMVGVISGALVIGWTLDVLHTAYTIGSPKLAAPQALLMASVAEGVFKGNLPWTMVIYGALLGVFIIVLDVIQEKRGASFRFPILAVAVGIYLPISLSTPIFIGGMLAHFAKKVGGGKRGEKAGLLMASGLITGEALMGILVAIPIFITGNKDVWPTMSWVPAGVGEIVFALVIIWLFYQAKRKI